MWKFTNPSTCRKYFEKNRVHGNDSLVLSLSQKQFQALMIRLDRVGDKPEVLIDRVIDEVNNGNKPKDLPQNDFFLMFAIVSFYNDVRILESVF